MSHAPSRPVDWDAGRGVEVIRPQQSNSPNLERYAEYCARWY
jgi:hypothetical protein